MRLQSYKKVEHHCSTRGKCYDDYRIEKNIIFFEIKINMNLKNHVHRTEITAKNKCWV